MTTLKTKKQRRIRRHFRVRSKIIGTADCPRLAFFRSNKQVYAQIIDDTARKTLLGLSSMKTSTKGRKTKAEELGVAIAKEAIAKGIKKVCFDRGGFLYTGTVKAFADSARKGGLTF
ncbi:MAG: 50S ribosomal protein L18 [Alphaproteobacteria bacterium]|nr:50S ribosomal protein L18 [Alphaproteobacteria bacterium]